MDCLAYTVFQAMEESVIKYISGLYWFIGYSASPCFGSKNFERQL